jgi:hypothetical protein
MARDPNRGPLFIIGIKSNASAKGVVSGFGDPPLAREIERSPLLVLMLGRCCHTTDGSREQARPLRFINGGLLSRYVFFSGTLSGHYS